MKSAILFSGGKDSTMALYNAINNGDEVLYLLSVKSRNKESYMFHVPNIEITDLISTAVDIPLITIGTDGEKEMELLDLKEGFKLLKDKGVEGIYTGALYSTYQKSRIEKLASELDLKVISPYWHVDQLQYMRDVVDAGFKVVICGVFALGLGKSFLGKTITHQLIDQLIKINDKVPINMAFEGGEAETIVLDGPIFKKRIEVTDFEILWDVDNGIYNIKEASLVDK